MYRSYYKWLKVHMQEKACKRINVQSSFIPLQFQQDAFQCHLKVCLVQNCQGKSDIAWHVLLTLSVNSDWNNQFNIFALKCITVNSKSTALCFPQATYT